MKKLTAIVLAVTLMMVQPINATSYIEPSIGDYISLGTYEGRSLTWQIVHKANGGQGVLSSAEIVDYMAYDSAEAAGTNGREIYGSNAYANSNIHEWLNSDGVRVTYSTTAPTIETVAPRMDIEDHVDYGVTDSYKGFLYGFTEKEKRALIEKTVPVYKSIEDDIFTETSMFSHVASGYFQDSLVTLAGGRYELISARVLLLSAEEIQTYIVDNDLSITRSYQNNDPDYYWLRNPDGVTGSLVGCITYSGNIGVNTANYAAVGVVPSISINIADYPVISGDGSKNSPYVLDFTNSEPITSLLSADVLSAIEAEVVAYGQQLVNDTTIESYEAVVRNIEASIEMSSDPYKYRKAYNYYLSVHNVSLHRSLFLESPLLTIIEAKEVKNYSDIAGLDTTELEAVNVLTQMGIIEGYPDGSLNPAGTITRAEMAKMLTLTTQKMDRTLTRAFNDVGYGDWFYEYVENAKLYGYINGYGDGSFKPNLRVTYDETSAMISRVLTASYGYYRSDETINEAPYVASWAQEYVSLLKDVSVYESLETYNGGKPVKRIDVIVALAALVERIYQ